MELQLQNPVKLQNQTFVKQLKSTPNATLQGNTFDAKHLDSFLMSEWGDRPNLEANRYQNLPPQVATDRGNTRTPLPGQRATSSMPFVQTNIRPSYAFISIGREYPSQSSFFDLSGKSSTLLHRPELRTQKQKMSQTLYDSERKELKTHFNNKELFFDAPAQEGLKNPTQRRHEIEEMKQKQDEFKTQQAFFKFMNKRDRTIKNGWRSGILGVELRGDNKHSTFYSDVTKVERKVERRSNREQEARMNTLKKFKDTNSDIPFYNAQSHKRASESVSELPPKRAIDRDWKVKRKVEIEHRTEMGVKQSVFAHSAKQNIHRTEHLKQQDTRSKGYNILSGGIH